MNGRGVIFSACLHDLRRYVKGKMDEWKRCDFFFFMSEKRF